MTQDWSTQPAIDAIQARAAIRAILPIMVRERRDLLALSRRNQGTPSLAEAYRDQAIGVSLALAIVAGALSGAGYPTSTDPDQRDRELLELATVL